jgi:hypothetical protein
MWKVVRVLEEYLRTYQERGQQELKVPGWAHLPAWTADPFQFCKDPL